MHITIIEDEKILSKNISKKLIKNGFNTKIFNSYKDFIKNLDIVSDLYIIDISLIDGSGFDIIEYLRNKKNINSPIIITSGYSDPDKKIYGLDIGADDYLCKPFSSEELIARIRALLRRSYKVELNSNIKYKNFIYDTSNKIITNEGKIIYLGSIELRLAEYFLYNIGKLIKKTDLISSVWGEYSLLKVSDNTINVTLSKVRKKLGKEFVLKTIINEGYILEK